jgi:hypothetical protein
MNITLTSQIVRNKDLMSAPMDNEIVVLNMAGNNYIGLDEIGRRIWELVGDPCRVDEVCRRLSQEYEATPEQIAADVLPFLEELAAEGMIRVLD